MSARTDRYLDLALEGRHAAWRYVLGVGVIAVFWLGLGFVPYAFFARAGWTGPLADFVAVNFSIFIMFAGLVVAVKGLHGRPLLTLVTPGTRIDWRRMAHGAAVWGGIAAVIVLAEHALHPGRYAFTLEPARFLPFLLLVLVLTPLQCAAEELVFRGYVLQGLSLVTRRPALLAVLSSAVFTVPHLMNPEVGQYGAAIMAANYFMVGLIAATVTLRDGRLELAIGLHAANNVFIALIANYEGSALATASIFTARELDPVYSLISLIAGLLVFHSWVFRRRPEHP
jgi:uncharacterized protein